MSSSAIELLLFAGLLPLWLLAGWGDWLCHRVQRTEDSSGLPETLMHGAMLLSMAVAVSAALLLQPDAAVLLLVAACCVLHELIVWWDLGYADRWRRIPPVEQWVHAIQIAAPWVGLAGLAMAHADQALALVGRGAADWSWRARVPPVPAPWLAATVLAALLLVVLPFADEWRRAWRAAQRRRAASARPSPKAA